MFSRLSKVLMFTILGGVGPAVLGQGVGGNSPTDTSHVLTSIFSGDDFFPPSWRTIIGTMIDPISVELDPAGPAWVKHLQTQDMAPINPISGIIVAHEYLMVGGSRPWTGLHMEINTDGFIWFPYSTFPDPSPMFKMLADGLPVPFTIQLDGGKLDVSFPPLTPGTTVTIEQKFAWWIQDTPFTGSIEMREYPVPEPASLVGLGLLFLISQRRR